MMLSNKFLLTVFAVTYVAVATATEDSMEHGETTRKGTKKCLRVGQLTVCGNEQVGGNLSVNGTLTVGGSPIVPNAGGVLAFGSFYSNTPTASLDTGINLTAGVTSDNTSFVPLSGGTGTGVTVANAGTYIVWFSVLGQFDSGTWQLNTSAGPVPGSAINNDLTNDNSFANGFAVVTVPTNGTTITITGDMNTGTPAGAGQTVMMTIMRVK